MLLLLLIPESDKAISLAEAGLVKDNLKRKSLSRFGLLKIMSYLCASDSAISLGEISVQLEIVHLRGKVANPDGCINLKTIMFPVQSNPLLSPQ